MKKLLTVLAITLSFNGLAEKGVHVKFNDGDIIGLNYLTTGDRLSFPWDGMYIIETGVSVICPAVFDREGGDYVILRDTDGKKYGWRVPKKTFYWWGSEVNAYIIK